MKASRRHSHFKSLGHNLSLQQTNQANQQIGEEDTSPGASNEQLYQLRKPRLSTLAAQEAQGHIKIIASNSNLSEENPIANAQALMKNLTMKTIKESVLSGKGYHRSTQRTIPRN